MTTLNDENFEKEIQASQKFVLVDFFATWCEPCKMLTPVLEKVAEELKDKIVLLKANLDDIPKTAGKFQVEKIPTVILFKDGKPVSGFVGVAPVQAIKEWLNKFINPELKIKEMMANYENYASANGFRLNPNEKVVEGILAGLLANEKKYGKKYCPCRRVTGNEEEDAKKICPCAFHKDEIEKDGHCFCNLFVK